MEGYFVRHDGSFEVAPNPNPSPDSPDSPTPGHFHEYCHVHCNSHDAEGEEGAAAAAAGPRVTAAWEPWQSFVWQDSQRMNLEQKCWFNVRKF